jgi:hypothetical protein
MGRSGEGQEEKYVCGPIQKAKKTKPGMVLFMPFFLWQILCFMWQSLGFNVRLCKVQLHKLSLACPTCLLLAQTASGSVCNRSGFSYHFSGFSQALSSWSTDLLPDSGALKDLEKDSHIELVSDKGLGKECWRCNAMRRLIEWPNRRGQLVWRIEALGV